MTIADLTLDANYEVKTIEEKLMSIDESSFKPIANRKSNAPFHVVKFYNVPVRFEVPLEK